MQEWEAARDGVWRRARGRDSSQVPRAKMPRHGRLGLGRVRFPLGALPWLRVSLRLDPREAAVVVDCELDRTSTSSRWSKSADGVNRPME